MSNVSTTVVFARTEWQMPSVTFFPNDNEPTSVQLEAVAQYCKAGVEPSLFLRAVLENNLSEAVARADMHERYCLPAWISILNALPGDCWGSKRAVNKWLKLHAEGSE